MPEEFKQIYQQYQEGKISRRDFMQKLILVTGSLAAADGLIAGLAPIDAAAAMVADDDPAILTHNVGYKGKAGTVAAYLARPVKAGKYPGVVMIHENFGLDDHIRDVARRLSKEGFVVLAPDFLSRLGGTALVTPKGQGIPNIRELAPWDKIAEDAESGLAYLRVLSDVRSDQQGLLGFCWGGEVAFAAATQIRNLNAVVVYYGLSPNPLDLVKNITAPVLANYAEKDEAITKGVNATAAAMKKYNKVYDYKIYPGAQHAFNNDTRKDRYDAQASKEAWGRTVEFLKKTLKT
jgi:carboxymethylenebutenolidase